MFVSQNVVVKYFSISFDYGSPSWNRNILELIFQHLSRKFSSNHVIYDPFAGFSTKLEEIALRYGFKYIVKADLYLYRHRLGSKESIENPFAAYIDYIAHDSLMGSIKLSRKVIVVTSPPYPSHAKQLRPYGSFKLFLEHILNKICRWVRACYVECKASENVIEKVVRNYVMIRELWVMKTQYSKRKHYVIVTY